MVGGSLERVGVSQSASRYEPDRYEPWSLRILVFRCPRYGTGCELLQSRPHEFVNKAALAQCFKARSSTTLDRCRRSVPTMNRQSRAATKNPCTGAVHRCCAALLLGFAYALRRRPCTGGRRYRYLPKCHGGTGGPSCGLRERDRRREDHRQPSRAAAFAYRGDSLMKKRDYDGAIAAFSAAHEIDAAKRRRHQRAGHRLQLQGRRRAGAGRL